MIKMFLAFLSTGERVDQQNYLIREMEKTYKDRIQFVYPSDFVGRIFHDYARNCYVEEFLQTDCDVMWFLDSDVIPHHNVLSLFDSYEQWDLAGAPYPVFMAPNSGDIQKVIFTVYKDLHGDGKLRAVPIREGREFVEGIATGCIFIKRNVFDKVKPPYFEFKFDPETRCLIEGEDLGFCFKTNKAGLKFYVDYSLVCGHIKKVDLLAVNNYAMKFADDSIMNYDRMLRSQIAKKKLAEMERRQTEQAKKKSGLYLPPSLSGV